MMKQQLSPKDWILISSYLDGELNPREKSQVEARLAVDSNFQTALQELKENKQFLRQAPRLRVPRNFTVSAAAVQPRPIPRFLPTLRFSSAAAVLVAVFLMVAQLLPGISPMTQMAAEPAAKEFAAEVADTQPSTPPQILYWGQPSYPQTAYGRGGGGGDGVPVSNFDLIPEDPAAPYLPIFPEAGSAAPADLPAGTQTPAPTAAAESLAVPQAEQPAAAANSGPILGIRPTEMHGSILRQSNPATTSMDEVRPPISLPIQTIAAIGFLVLGIILAVLSVLLYRKSMR